MKTQIAAYLNRELLSFSASGSDVLGNCVNYARRDLQRRIDLQYCRARGFLNVSFLTGALLENTKIMGGEDTLLVKKIEAAFIYNAAGSGNYDGRPIPVISRWNDVARSARTQSTDFSTASQYTPSDISLVVQGQQVYFTGGVGAQYPADSALDIVLDVVAWLPDLSADDDSDFTLNECGDYILLKAVQQLNFFLKEDERVQITNSAVKETYESVVVWDAGLGGANDNTLS